MTRTGTHVGVDVMLGCLLEAVLEFVLEPLLRVVLLAVALVVSTPFVLVGAVGGPGSYRDNVRSGYSRVIRYCSGLLHYA